MASNTWATTQLSKILSLDSESIQEVLQYTSALSKDAAAEHLTNLLGDSPKALEFISSYNARREAPKALITKSEPPKSNRKPQKKKPPLDKLPPRQVENYGSTHGAYKKQDEAEYMASNKRIRPGSGLANTLALSTKPDAIQLPKTTSGSSLSSSKLPPSASGPLISDLPNVRASSRNNSRTSSPAPLKTKINVPGGASMHGASTTLQDLDSAIRTLELQTNPSISSPSTSAEARRCTCLATRHPLLTAAPNCLNCGKIICVKEGIGPCTSCNTPLLSSAEVTAMIDSLRQERGAERMNANNASHRRADLASAPRPFTNPTEASSSSSTSISTTAGADKTLDLAKQHRDRLLSYQRESARRTHIIDEAADFETPTAGQSLWSSPVERAAQLKRQQKVLREQEWSGRPEWEKKRVVVSVDLVGGKVVRRMGEVEKPDFEKEDAREEGEGVPGGGGEGGGGGAFSKNPLMGNLIRPVWKNNGKGKNTAVDADAEGDKEHRPGKSVWRRVQDDDDDNEALILDGGIYGARDDERG